MLTKAHHAGQLSAIWSLIASALKRLFAVARIYHEEFLDAEAKAAECENGRHRHFAHRDGASTRRDEAAGSRADSTYRARSASRPSRHISS